MDLFYNTIDSNAGECEGAGQCKSYREDYYIGAKPQCDSSLYDIKQIFTKVCMMPIQFSDEFAKFSR